MPRRIDTAITGTLSDQQHVALSLYGQGNEVAEVAVIMGITTATAKEHLLRARRRLGARNNAHALKIAHDLGLMTASAARQREAALAAQLADQTTLAEQRLRALNRLHAKMPSGLSPVQAIHQAAYQLDLASRVPAGAPTQVLDNLSKSLGQAVDFIEIGEAERPVEAAVRVLNSLGLKVGTEYAQLVLDGSPDIIEGAAKLTWEDPQIQEMLFREAVVGMLAISTFRYSTMRDKGHTQLAGLFNVAYRTWDGWASSPRKVVQSAA